MKQIILVLTLFTSLFSELVEIQSVSDNGKYGKIAQNIQIGTTGIVVKTLENGFHSIVSYAEMQQDGKILFYDFMTLNQQNIPKGLWKPQAGDSIRFQENYKRAMILARDYNSYIQIKKKFSQEWIHPDLFASTLSSIGHQTPLSDDFHYFCRENSIGLLYIGFADEVLKVDCLSLKVIDTISQSFKADSTQKPFYSRIKKIDTNWFGAGIKEIVDFENYYRNLIK